MQQSDESLETFSSRLGEVGAHCRFENLEEYLVKDIFISNMRSYNIQMELLSEVRTPQQALNYAINRERGQANQQENLKANTSWNTVSYVRQNKPRASTLNTKQNLRPAGNVGAHSQWLISKHALQKPCKTICKKFGH